MIRLNSPTITSGRVPGPVPVNGPDGAADVHSADTDAPDVHRWHVEADARSSGDAAAGEAAGRTNYSRING